MKRFLILVLLTGILFSCSDGGLISEDPDDTTNTPLGSKAKVYDSTETFIGYSTSSDYVSLTIYTTKGYFIDLEWNGSIACNRSVWYSGLNRGGIPFFCLAPSYIVNGKSTRFDNGVLYRCKDINGMGLAEHNALITTYSSYGGGGNLTNCDPPVALNPVNMNYELEIVSRSDIGLPDVITPPLTLSWE